MLTYIREAPVKKVKYNSIILEIVQSVPQKCNFQLKTSSFDIINQYPRDTNVTQ